MKIALVELSNSHDECMFGQINALIAFGVELHLIAHPKVIERLTDFHKFDGTYSVETTGKAIADFHKMKSIVHYLKTQGISKVVFNTAQGGHIRNLRFLMPKQIQCYGIIHTINKFNKSKTQKIIHKMIKRYAVLSDILKEGINGEIKNNVTTYYPIEYPSYGSHHLKHSSDFWITIPGGIETRRKDLSMFVNFAKQCPPNFKFVFAGKSNLEHPEIQSLFEEIRNANLEHQVITFHEHIPNEEFYQLIASTDMLMPLIHPNTLSSQEYPYHQISGSFNLSFAFKIPLFIHYAYAGLDDLRVAANFYEPQRFGEDLKNALLNLSNKRSEIASQEKWNLEVQRQNYLRFVELI